MLDDSEIWFVDDFSTLSGLDRDETLQLELEVYSLLEYKVHISQDEYKDFVAVDETKITNDIADEGTKSVLPQSKQTKKMDF